MTSDPGQREPRGRRPDFALPRVVRVSSRRAQFDPPPPRNFDSELPRGEATVEIVVETDGPMPIRALSPVLYVGAVPVTEMSAEDDTHYLFVALRPNELADGSPISLGWCGQSADETQDTTFRYQAPAD